MIFIFSLYYFKCLVKQHVSCTLLHFQFKQGHVAPIDVYFFTDEVHCDGSIRVAAKNYKLYYLIFLHNDCEPLPTCDLKNYKN